MQPYSSFFAVQVHMYALSNYTYNMIQHTNIHTRYAIHKYKIQIWALINLGKYDRQSLCPTAPI